MILTGSKTFDHYLLWQVLFNTYGIKDHINGLNAACKKKKQNKKNCDWEQYNMHNLCVNIFYIYNTLTVTRQAAKRKKKMASVISRNQVKCDLLTAIIWASLWLSIDND